MPDNYNNQPNSNSAESAKPKIRLRRFTPKECWRLMDFDDDDFERAESIVSNSRLYMQAGNSIVVNCLVAVFGQLFDGKENVYKQRQDEIMERNNRNV